MNGLTVFNNAEFGSVRTMLIDNEPWFAGKDVAEALGYTNPRKAISDHIDDEDKGVTKCDTLGGSQDLVIINESGLYSLIMSSKLPSAKKFKHWVTSEVLPAIRKTGQYGTATNNVDLRALTEYLDFLKTDLENRKSSPSNIAYVIMDVSKQFGIDLPKDFEPRRKRLVEPQVESEPSTAFETTPEITASVNINYNLDSQCSVFAERLNKLANITFAENIQTMTKELPSPKRRNKHPDSEQPNIEVETTDETPSVVFIFDSYSLVVPNREGLAEDVMNNSDKWLTMAKKADYDKAAEKVRAERNQLLAETDKEMAFDRLDVHIPEKITTSTLLACVKAFFEAMAAIKNSPMAKYRKALRDIPEQEGFPYNVVFPNKPN